MPTDVAPPAGRLSGAALHDAKRALRERVIAERDALPLAARNDGAHAICDRIVMLEPFRAARRALLTLAFRSEWDTRPLVEAALLRGVEVLLPRVDGATRMLDLFVIADIDRDTAPGYRGIREPRP